MAIIVIDIITTLTRTVAQMRIIVDLLDSSSGLSPVATNCLKRIKTIIDHIDVRNPKLVDLISCCCNVAMAVSQMANCPAVFLLDLSLWICYQTQLSQVS